jgi:hypothetical protein
MIELSKLRLAFQRKTVLSGFADDRQEDANQNGDDADDDQDFYERERSRAGMKIASLPSHFGPENRTH